jgi:hypothetical protein
VLTGASDFHVHIDADPKIRVRAIKKGVTLGDLTHYYTTPLAGTPPTAVAVCLSAPIVRWCCDFLVRDVLGSGPVPATTLRTQPEFLLVFDISQSARLRMSD